MTHTSELFIEVFCEELPARMQLAGLDAFKAYFEKAFHENKITFGDIKAHVTPRRLALTFSDILTIQPDRSEHRRGPRIDAPDKAIAGFAASVGLSQDALEINTIDKGQFYGATLHKTGVTLAALLEDIFPMSFAAINWPKNMRWGTHAAPWARPIHQVTCLLAGELIPVSTPYPDVPTTAQIQGHRFLSPGPFPITDAASYEKGLLAHHVVLSFAQRRETIITQATALAKAHNLTLLQDERLFDELAGLVEWPVCYWATLDAQFMSLPREVLVSTLTVHQRYLCLAHADGTIAPAFIIVSNMETPDQGRTIITGNEKVAHARLSDGVFCYDKDKKEGIATFSERLKGIVFHEKLGTMQDKAKRLGFLCHKFAPVFNVNPTLAQTAGVLAKADLTSQMVGEFPELQGIMGGYYCQSHDLAQGSELAPAIRDHYLPTGPDAPLPDTALGKLLSFADKMDTLVGFFAAGIRPTSSKDPYALRRACLGILRLLPSETELLPLLQNSLDCWVAAFKAMPCSLATDTDTAISDAGEAPNSTYDQPEIIQALHLFFQNRLTVLWREQGFHHEHIRAIVSHPPYHGLPIGTMSAHLSALSDFLQHPEGAGLMPVFRRAANIVAIAEKEEILMQTTPLSENDFTLPEEKALWRTRETAAQNISTALENQQYAAAFTEALTLLPPLTAFFETVTVNCDEPSVRLNRLRSLQMTRECLAQLGNLALISEDVTKP